MSSAIAPLFETDAYKLGHKDQYPEGTNLVYSNYTNRGSRLEGVTHVVHFGLQAFLAKHLTDGFAEFFDADEDIVAFEYERRLEQILGPNNIGSEHIRALHQKGYLPLRFSAVPEGTRVPLRVPSFVFENTDPDFYWLTNYIETVLSASVWAPSTAATLAFEYRQILDAAALRTGGEGVDWQLHDFSFRGMSSPETAAATGAGHLLSFTGSDSLGSLEWIENYYGDGYMGAEPNGLILGSVPATEHSVMCAGGQDDELATYKRLLELYPTGIVSVVSDTWDLWNVVTSILPTLKEQILGRDGKLVIRPDSGDPVDIITGNSKGKTPAAKGLIELLWDTFGGTVNDAGFKVLDSHIGAIYGDSITLARAQQIVDRLEAKGFASTNIVLGVGSYTYQYVTRDTFGSAVKATYVEIDGVGRAIQKNPVTDSGLKKSATGRLALHYRGEGGELVLTENADLLDEGTSILQPIWEDGRFLKWQSFEDVRATLRQAVNA